MIASFSFRKTLVSLQPFVSTSSAAAAATAVVVTTSGPSSVSRSFRCCHGPRRFSQQIIRESAPSSSVDQKKQYELATPEQTWEQTASRFRRQRESSRATTGSSGSATAGFDAILNQARARQQQLLDDPTATFHDLQEHTWKHNWAVNEVMAFGRHTKVTKGGRIFSVSALVLLGNGKGSAGYGYGKALTANQAVQRAQQDAERNIISIPRFQDRTISTSFTVKQDGVRLFVAPLAKGQGIKAGSTNELLARAFGLTDILIKSYGRRNMKSWVRAFFAGVHKHAKPTLWKSAALGKKLR